MIMLFSFVFCLCFIVIHIIKNTEDLMSRILFYFILYTNASLGLTKEALGITNVALRLTNVSIKSSHLLSTIQNNSIL
ncbi:hypothetical protein RDI58_003863 [Solanum bulbocastanum]|uniref:Uncharacterized protein n=1 Tax=Solanum bulbocastanum TaxID=147425 RepID=A0AAN8U5I5_SOLBU